MQDGIYRLEDHEGLCYIVQGQWVESNILGYIIYGDYVDHRYRDKISNASFYKFQYCVERLPDKYELKDYLK